MKNFKSLTKKSPLKNREYDLFFQKFNAKLDIFILIKLKNQVFWTKNAGKFENHD